MLISCIPPCIANEESQFEILLLALKSSVLCGSCMRAQFAGCGSIMTLHSLDLFGANSSLDPRPSDICIPMEGLVRDDHVR